MADADPEPANPAAAAEPEEAAPPARPAAPARPPLDIVISFDVTGSMMPVLAAVRENLDRLTATIFASGAGAGTIALRPSGSGNPADAVALRARHPSTRMMVFAHGDYDSTPYRVISTKGFTDDPHRVSGFIRSVSAVTNGWNEGENYEEVLDRCCALDWRPEARKLLILVGDDLPHPPHFPQNTRKLDWRRSIQHLAEMDVRCFAVQCASMSIARAESFYRALAAAHRLGRYVLLSQFYMMSELVLGIFHAASDDMVALREHEAELQRTGRRTRNMARAFAALRGEEENPAAGAAPAGPAAPAAGAHADPGALQPVPEGRFQLLPVGASVVIKAFVEATGARFKAGRGFYELTKAESIGHEKEIVLERRATGEFFTGDGARGLLGIGRQQRATYRISPTAAAHRPIFAEYRIFVQSTSYNRRLMPGTMFLYELDGDQ
jgi:hypothetical protein